LQNRESFQCRDSAWPQPQGNARFRRRFALVGITHAPPPASLAYSNRCQNGSSVAILGWPFFLLAAADTLEFEHRLIPFTNLRHHAPAFAPHFSFTAL